MMFSLSSCAYLTFRRNGGNVDGYKVIPHDGSKIYSDDDIERAITEVETYFRLNFSGCTLLELGYAGDGYADQFEELSERYGAEVIILLSSFYVDASGGDGSLNTDYTYTNYKWILVRDNLRGWRHVDHGYG